MAVKSPVIFFQPQIDSNPPKNPAERWRSSGEKLNRKCWGNQFWQREKERTDLSICLKWSTWWTLRSRAWTLTRYSRKRRHVLRRTHLWQVADLQAAGSLACWVITDETRWNDQSWDIYYLPWWLIISHGSFDDFWSCKFWNPIWELHVSQVVVALSQFTRSANLNDTSHGTPDAHHPTWNKHSNRKLAPFKDDLTIKRKPCPLPRMFLTSCCRWFSHYAATGAHLEASLNEVCVVQGTRMKWAWQVGVWCQDPH